MFDDSLSVGWFIKYENYQLLFSGNSKYFVISNPTKSPWGACSFSFCTKNTRGFKHRAEKRNFGNFILKSISQSVKSLWNLGMFSSFFANTWFYNVESFLPKKVSHPESLLFLFWQQQASVQSCETDKLAEKWR